MKLPDRRKILPLLLMLGLTPGLWAPAAWARSLQVVRSSPAADAILNGRDMEYAVHFDGLVDHHASRLWITRDGKTIETLQPLLDAAPETLFASAPKLPTGSYQLHWSARSAPDGEVTEGMIAFTVQP